MKESDLDKDDKIPTHAHQFKQTISLADDERAMLSSRNSRAEEKQAQTKKVARKGKLPWWLGTFFWVLRKCIAPIIMIAMLVVGLYVGYVVLAGQPSSEVFKIETWRHLWDLIFADV